MSSKKIIITSNIKNQEKKGIKIIAKDYTINDDINKGIIDNFNNLKIYYTPQNREKNKNKIILCGHLIDRNEVDEDGVQPKNEHNNLITRYNIKNNIIHFNYYKKNENRLIFKKSNAVIDNDLFLFDFSINTNSNKSLYLTINDISFLYTNQSYIKDNSFIVINYNLYYSYNKSDYYNFRFSDFVDLSGHKNEALLNNYTISYENIYLSNSFIDNSYINYNESYFNNIYCLSNNKINIIPKKQIINDKSDNILLFNKYGNTTKLEVNYNTNTNKLDSSINDVSYINFEIIKQPNIYNKYYGKILINNNFIGLNSRVSSNNYNLFSKYVINNDNSSNIYLSFGNNICGLTQNNIFNNMYFDNDDLIRTKVNKIFFTGSGNFINKPSTNKYSLHYLLNDNSYNDVETNIFRLIKDYPKDSATGLTNKITNVNLLDFFTSIGKDISKNIFYKAFNNYEVSNNLIDYGDFNIIYEKERVFLNTNNNNLIKSTQNFRVIIDDNMSLESSVITPQNINLNYNNNYNLKYDFRYNYDNISNSTLLLTFYYLDDGHNFNLNFYKIELSNFYKTIEAGDFKDVACIFEYYDPIIGGVSYEYPYNNIKVINNVTIDNLSRAIELLPNAGSATSNTIFIPERNGSNLSKKRIQGLIGSIGFGKKGIAKLLSIEPYDNNSRIGRGFNNQFNLNDGTLDPSNLKLTNNEVVALKYNSQKHSSQKQNNNITNKKNFADLVRNSSRSRNINLNSPSSCSNEPPNIPKQQYYTPFRMFKTNKGNYLRSGK